MLLLTLVLNTLLVVAHSADSKSCVARSNLILKSAQNPTKNSNNKTHSVAELKPLKMNGREIFDLYGNVHEWGYDFYQRTLPSNVINPVGPDTGEHRVQRGGSFDLAPKYHQAGYRNYDLPNARSESVGFRLVRTLP